MGRLITVTGLFLIGVAIAITGLANGLSGGAWGGVLFGALLALPLAPSVLRSVRSQILTRTRPGVEARVIPMSGGRPRGIGSRGCHIRVVADNRSWSVATVRPRFGEHDPRFDKPQPGRLWCDDNGAPRLVQIDEDGKPYEVLGAVEET